MQADAGVPARRRGEGVASQVGLARRESPNRGAQHLGLGKILTTEMPHTLAALTEGWLSEWRATLLVRETACLTLGDRRAVDSMLAGHRHEIENCSDHQLVQKARKLAYELDPESVVRRNRRAVSDRTVTCRPAPDTMVYVTALVPVQQGVAMYAALRRQADSLRAAGDPRSRGQAMADTMVERVTGQATASAVPVEVQLVITDRALLHGANDPAEIAGYGVVPAEWARDLVSDDATLLWLRRLYSAPGTGELVAMDSRARILPKGLKKFIQVRDGGICRTPWCGAPIRHGDHAIPHAAGGETSGPNTQGLCERCNLAKQAMGWRARPRPGPRHTVEVTTPTGHTYRSTAPPLPGTTTTASRAELYFAHLVLAA